MATLSTIPLTEAFPSLVFVWPSNWGSGTFIEKIATSQTYTPALYEVEIFAMSETEDMFGQKYEVTNSDFLKFSKKYPLESGKFFGLIRITSGIVSFSNVKDIDLGSKVSLKFYSLNIIIEILKNYSFVGFERIKKT